MPPATRPVSTTISSPALDTQVFWVKYRTQILLGIAGLVIAGVLVAGYFLYLARRDAAATTMLAEAKTPADYQKVISEYSGAGATVTAYLLLADEQRKEQKFADANATLKAFIDQHPKDDFVPTARMAMAGNLESLGKTDEALDTYRSIAIQSPRSYNAPFALMAEVPLLQAKGQTDEARRVCETVLTQYRDSYASAEATRQLRLLKPATAPAAAIVPAAIPQASAAPSSQPAPAATP